MGDAVWWYEWEGRQAGPVAEEGLLAMLRGGQLAPSARVWRAGMAGWEPAASVADLTRALASQPSHSDSRPMPGPTATAAPPQGSAQAPAQTQAPAATWAQPQPASSPADALPSGLEPVSLGAVLGLGIVTLGIYPAVKFYQAVQAYQALAGRPSRFTTWFWLAIGLSLLGGPAYLLGGFTGFAAQAGGLVFTVVALFEALALRGEAVRRWGVSPVLTSDATHKALFVVGLVTSWLFVGLILLVVQAVKFFDDHRALGDALRARAAAPPASAP